MERKFVEDGAERSAENGAESSVESSAGDGAEKDAGNKEKFAALREILTAYGRVAVAFSGGVDSTFLLTAAVEVLGSERVVALFVDSPMVMEQERQECIAFCRERGIRLVRLSLLPEELAGAWKNPPDRCYICKHVLFTRMRDAAGAAVLIEGTNADDLKDYRPGIRALKELKIKSPLLEAGYTKTEIRGELRKRQLSVWEKPAYACLASRIPYEDPITEEKLRRIDQAEEELRSMGFCQVRVRYLSEPAEGRSGLRHVFSKGMSAGMNMVSESAGEYPEARIEVLPEAISRLMEDTCFEKVKEVVREAGFASVSVEPDGYRKGRLNDSFLTSDSAVCRESGESWNSK